ncbi:MAG TPA: DMT family transporter [Gaiellaceae bacterium]
MTAVLLALGASFAWGFADFGAGAAARRLPVFVVAAVSQSAGLLFVGAIVLATSASVPSRTQLAWAAFAGVVGLVGLSFFYRALAVGTMGVIGPITATAAIVPIAYGLGQGERPSALQGAGVGLAVVGVIAASLEPLPEGRGRQLGTGVGFALAAAFSFGWSLVGLGRAAEGGVAFATMTMRIAAVPIGILLALTLKRRAPSPRGWLLLGAVGVTDTGATLLYGAAAARGLLSVVAVLSSLYPIVIVVLARLFFAERVARTQLAGVAVALAGVALISAG